MDSLFDLLKHKANKIDVDRKLTELELAQAELDRFANGDANVSRLTDDGKLFIQTKSSALSGELRMQQLAIVKSVSKATKKPVTKVIIQIR